MNSACENHSFASREDRRRLHSCCSWSQRRAGSPAFLVFWISLLGCITPVDSFSPDTAVHLAVGLSGVVLGLSAPRLGLMLQSGEGKRKRKGNGFHQCNSCRIGPNLELECDGAMPICNNCARSSRRRCGWGKCNCDRADCQAIRGGVGSGGGAATYGTFGASAPVASAPAPAPPASLVSAPWSLPFNSFLPFGFALNQSVPHGYASHIDLEAAANDAPMVLAELGVDPAPAPMPLALTAGAVPTSQPAPESTSSPAPTSQPILAPTSPVPSPFAPSSASPTHNEAATETPIVVLRQRIDRLSEAIVEEGIYSPGAVRNVIDGGELDSGVRRC